MTNVSQTATVLNDADLENVDGGRYGNAWMPLGPSVESNLVTMGGVPNTADSIFVRDELDTAFEINF